MLSQFHLTFLQTQRMILIFILHLLIILGLIGLVFLIFWEMFHERISINRVLLPPNVWNRSSLELMFTSLIVNIRSKRTSFLCKSRINLVCVRSASDRLVIVAKEISRVLNLLIANNKKVYYFSESWSSILLAHGWEMTKKFSTNVNLLFLLDFTVLKVFPSATDKAKFIEQNLFWEPSSWWFRYSFIYEVPTLELTLEAPTPQNGQTHSNNSSAFADELFECV